MSLAARLAVVAVVGAAAAIVAATRAGMPAGWAADLVLWAGAAALVAGALGTLALRVVKARSIAAQITVVALTAIGAVAAGALVAANQMFISTPDLQALIVVLAASGTVGVLIAMTLGYRVAASSRGLEALALRLGEGGPATGEGVAATGELAALGRRLEETSLRLEEARAQERALDRSRRELVAWVSHDLRTPLAGIRALVEALEDGVVDDPATVERYHRTLRQEADRLALLVDDLFELSTIQAGALRLQLEQASLGDVVSDALAASTPVAVAKGIRLEGRLNGRAPSLELSTPEISRALRNLLENAIRHTPSDGAVFVEVSVADGQAVVSVADACGGIPESELPRLFEPAFRGEAARTPGSGGRSGLGLAIVRGIVEAHQGDVAVANEGAGCRFTVRLPLASAANR